MATLEDKYLRLRDENTALKKENNELRVVIKSMKTKLAMIEEKAAKLQSGWNAQSTGSGRKPLLGSESTGAPSKSVDTTRRSGVAPRPPDISADKVAVLQRVVRDKNAEIEDLHAQLSTLEHRLRDVAASGVAAGIPSKPPQDQTELEEELYAMERHIQDKTAQITLLQNRYEQLQGKLVSERELSERTLRTLDDQNRQLRDLRNSLQAFETENAILRSRCARLEDTESDLRSTREDLRRMEERFTELCAAPFFQSTKSGGMTGKEFLKQTERLNALEKLTKEQELQIEHLQKTVRGRHVEYESLAKERLDLLDKLDTLQKRCETLQAQFDNTSRGNASLRGRIALLTGGSEDAEGIPLDQLEHALAIVRRRMDNPSKVDFLDQSSADDSVPTLRKEVQQLRLTVLASQQESERLGEMLRVQRAICTDLTEDLKAANARASEDVQTVRRRLQDAEALCEKRLSRIRLLEAQVRQLLYDGRSSLRASQALKLGAISPYAADDQGSIGGFTDDSFATAELKFEQGENVVEIYVVEARLSALGPADTTFAIIDFYDFESQSSPLASGADASYNFSATYKVTCDAFFLKHLAQESVVIDVIQTKRSGHLPLGKAELPLKKLLGARGRVVYDAATIRSKDGRVVGALRVELRLALPVSEMWETYLADHPEERVPLVQDDVTGADGTARQLSDAPRALPSSSLANELIVTVKEASALQTRSGKAPSAYVQYEVPSHAKTFSLTVPRNTDPVFNDTRKFPVTADEQYLRYLQHNPVRFVVFDDDEREDDGVMLGLPGSAAHLTSVIGTVTVDLSPLLRNSTIDRSFDVMDANNRRVGSLSIKIGWEHAIVPVLPRVEADPVSRPTSEKPPLSHRSQRAMTPSSAAHSTPGVTSVEVVPTAKPSAVRSAVPQLALDRMLPASADNMVVDDEVLIGPEVVPVAATAQPLSSRPPSQHDATPSPLPIVASPANLQPVSVAPQSEGQLSAPGPSSVLSARETVVQPTVTVEAPVTTVPTIPTQEPGTARSRPGSARYTPRVPSPLVPAPDVVVIDAVPAPVSAPVQAVPEPVAAGTTEQAPVSNSPRPEAPVVPNEAIVTQPE